MANRPAVPLVLRDGDRPRLEAIIRSPSVQAGLAQRARILLLAADGASNTEIADKVGVSRPTVLVWRQRYAEEGFDGLGDRARPGRRPSVMAADVLAATLQPPPGRLGVAHWSSRLLGAHLGVGRGTVARAWQGYAVQPVRGGFRFGVAPALAGRVVAVLALRLGAPESLAVLDVRPPVRAGDRPDGAAAALPDLVSALRRAAQTRPDDPASSLLGFLDEVNRTRAAWPTASRLHLVTDGTGPVGLPALREALAVRSRISVHTVRDADRWPGLVGAALAMAAHGRPVAADLVAAFEQVRRGLEADQAFEWSHRPTPGQRTVAPYPTVK
jgi:hypothetical protein